MTIAHEMRKIGEREFELGVDPQLRPWARWKTTGETFPLPGVMADRLLGLYAAEHDNTPALTHARTAIKALTTQALTAGPLPGLAEETVAAAFPAPPPGTTNTAGKPTIRLDKGGLGAERELLAHIADRDDIFRRDGKLVWIRADDNGRAVLRPFEKTATFQKWVSDNYYVEAREETERGWTCYEAPLPTATAGRIIGAEHWRGVEHVAGLSRIPAVRGDGTLRSSNGYDPGTGVWFDVDDDLLDLGIPEHPTATDVAAAVATIDDVLGGFPFVDKADRANAVGLLLTPAAFAIIAAAVPAHAVTAGEQASGKSLLGVELPGLMAGGHDVMTFTGEEPEMRKLLTATLKGSGARILAFDNVDPRDVFESAVLAKAITGGKHQDRLLGSNETIEFTFDRIIVATGNKLRAGKDMRSRTVAIRLDARTPNPAGREFALRLDNPRELAALRRPLIAASLTLVRGWVRAGMPEPAEPPYMRQFTRWATVIGGMLAWAGIEGHLTNRDALTANDPRAEADRFLLERLADVMPARFTVGDVVAAINEHPEWDEGLPAVLGEHVRRYDTFTAHGGVAPSTAKNCTADSLQHLRAKLGYYLRDTAGTWHGDVRLTTVGQAHGNVAAWGVERYVAD